ncbi:ferredoxin [Planosporangium sp. 12N6]|uniref:ferredoxin n=1 Tax=Planosporangium spinosum TaxID=3402278 RepID=UPI003CF053D0
MSGQTRDVGTTMRIVIDTDRCSGHGRCYGLAGQFFDCDDEGFPVVINESVPENVEGVADLRAAVDNCPERAISLVHED